MKISIDELRKKIVDVGYLENVIEKVLLTLEKYELIIPEIPDMLDKMEENLSRDDEDKDHPLWATRAVFTVLGEYKSRSPFMIELWDSMMQDVCHGFDKNHPKHEGEFYVRSVTD